MNCLHFIFLILAFANCLDFSFAGIHNLTTEEANDAVNLWKKYCSRLSGTGAVTVTDEETGRIIHCKLNGEIIPQEKVVTIGGKEEIVLIRPPDLNVTHHINATSSRVRVFVKQPNIYHTYNITRGTGNKPQVSFLKPHDSSNTDCRCPECPLCPPCSGPECPYPCRPCKCSNCEVNQNQQIEYPYSSLPLTQEIGGAGNGNYQPQADGNNTHPLEIYLPHPSGSGFIPYYPGKSFNPIPHAYSQSHSFEASGNEPISTWALPPHSHSGNGKLETSKDQQSTNAQVEAQAERRSADSAAADATTAGIETRKMKLTENGLTGRGKYFVWRM